MYIPATPLSSFTIIPIPQACLFDQMFLITLAATRSVTRESHKFDADHYAAKEKKKITV